MEADFAIETENLCKSFASLRAVRDFNLKVGCGRLHGFVGPNGAGKSTVIKLLAGTLRADSGSGSICGSTIGSVEARAKVGYSPETPRFYDDMTAAEYLFFTTDLYGIARAVAAERLAELAELFDLGRDLHKRTRSLSAGNLKKVSIIQAMLHEPPVLLLDEPTANLDPVARQSFITCVKTLAAEKGTAVFVSSHALGELEAFIDDLTLISAGRVMLEGSMTDIRKEFDKGRFLLRTSNNAMAGQLLKEAGLAVSTSVDENGTLVIITDNSDRLKKDIFKIMEGSFLKLDYFSAENVTLESIYNDAYRKMFEEEADEHETAV